MTGEGPDGAADDGGTARDEGGLTEADRDAAVAALDVHRDAGRLDDVGFEDRSVRARRAWTQADLELLFLDLPEPHPVLGAPAWGSAPAAGRDLAPSAPPAAPPWGRDATSAPVPMSTSPVPARPPLVSPQVAQTVVALSPFVAVALWYFTGSWIFFLLIPVTGVLFGDAAGKKKRRR
ncbi:MAG: DUF1707 domain-containing protein [Actinobacteria bacterium]|nr:DUF1707 domain-containing protein [Actinomycetota bacterium]